MTGFGNKEAVPQKTAVPQNIQSSTAKNTAKFAVLDEEDDSFDDTNFAVQKNDWRIEKRFYTKKNGDIMLYWNYRGKPRHDSDKRIVPYKSGGKKLWQRHTN